MVKRIVIVIGGNIKKDLKECFDNPEKALEKQGCHNIYLKKESDLKWLFSKKGFLLLKTGQKAKTERGVGRK